MMFGVSCQNTTLLHLIICFLFKSRNILGESYGDRRLKALNALEYLDRVRLSPCTGGTEEVLPVTFNHDIWKSHAEVALRMANLLTKRIIYKNNTLSAEDESFLFDLVRNNVEGDDLIFGSAIAVEEYVFPKYVLFCPYAYNKNGIHSHDISLNYDYTTANTEWYNTLRERDWRNISTISTSISYRLNLTAHEEEKQLKEPTAKLSDGHWTYPYYDCGGGDIWMVTYSAPIFGVDGSTNVTIFRGVGTIDIELTNIDINQCDHSDFYTSGQMLSPQENSDNVFAGTHQCRPTTTCVPVQGMGFRRGAYRCVCNRGYYFPDINSENKFYQGMILEEFFANLNSSFNESVYKNGLADFTCLKCAEGCESCVDDTPCLFYHNVFVRLALLGVTGLEVLVAIVFSSLVAFYSKERAIKSASPVFLHLMTLGVILMYGEMMILFPQSTVVLCVLRPWFNVIGFALAYGALLLKTWRISIIFKVKSAQKVTMTDKRLAKRMMPIVCCAAILCITWTVAARSKPIWLKTTDGLKYMRCSTTWCDYASFGGQSIFLLWGVYLCFIVRKAPSAFNESKYITWAIYNNVILGSFIIIIREFIAIDKGPNIIYAVSFLHVQVSATVVILVIYIPKFVTLYRAKKTGGDQKQGTSISDRKKNDGGKVNVLDVDLLYNLQSKDVEVQTIVTWPSSEDLGSKETICADPSGIQIETASTH